jgi:hypothetical protein
MNLYLCVMVMKVICVIDTLQFAYKSNNIELIQDLHI